MLATASSDDRLERLHELGLDHGINYTATDFVEAVARLTDGRGADVIVDSVGGSTLQRSLHCLAYRGRCVTFGDAGRRDAVDPRHLLHAGQQPDTGRLLPRRRAVPRHPGPRHDRPVTSTTSPPASCAWSIDRRFPLEQAGEAHAYIESRQAFGRVLLIP